MSNPMPTESEFRRAAHNLRSELGELTGLMQRVRNQAPDYPVGLGLAPFVTGNSTLAGALMRSFGQIGSDYDRAAYELEELAELCDERAEVCEDHRWAVYWWNYDRDAHIAAARAYYLAGGTGSYPEFTDPYPETEPWVELE